jgi:hypothetical protein
MLGSFVNPIGLENQRRLEKPLKRSFSISRASTARVVGNDDDVTAIHEAPEKKA